MFLIIFCTTLHFLKDSAAALCASISPIDQANANKPGTAYDTEMGDDCKYSYIYVGLDRYTITVEV